MKRILSLALAFVLALSLVPAVHAQGQVYSGFCGGVGNEENVTWTLDTSTGTLTISGTGETAHYGSQGVSLYTPWRDIPGRINTVIVEEGVTSLGASIFDSLSINSITIPRSVTAIYKEALRNCRNLTSFTLPAQVTTFSHDALTMCLGLTEINVEPGNPNFRAVDGVLFTMDGKTLIQYPRARTAATYAVPAGVENINSYAFYNSKLTDVTLPEGLKYIGTSAFGGCQGLTSIDLPDSVEGMGKFAFSNCWRLTQVNWPAGLRYFESSYFTFCDSLAAINVHEGNEDYYSIDGVVFSRSGYDPYYPTTGPSLIYYPTGKRDTAYTVPAGVTDIGGLAFQNNLHLQKVDVPGSVEYIWSHAFDSCMNLSQVTLHEGLRSIFFAGIGQCGVRSLALPASLEYLKDCALTLNQKLETVTVAPGSQDFCAVDNVLFTKDKSDLILYPAKKTGESYVLPDTVKKVGTNAFTYNAQLKRVTIPASVKQLGAGAFQYCSNLSSVTFLGSAPIGEQESYQNTFMDCRSPVIYYPADDPTWTDAAKAIHDSGYGSITWVPLGGVLASGAWGAPGNEQNVTWRIQNGVLTISGTGAMRNIVPGLLSEPQAWWDYKEKFTSVVIEEGVTNIGESAFYECSGLESVTLPRSLTTIGHGAFFLCSGLKSVTIPTGVTSIEAQAFDQTGLTDVYYSGSWARLDEIAQPYNADLFAARLHLSFDGTLGNGSLGWSYRDGGVKLTQAPANGTVLAATYDENGRMVSVKTLSATAAVQLTPSARLKLFWLDPRQAPNCPAAAAQTAGKQTATGGGGVS